MLPYVLYQLRNDLYEWGQCDYSITDSPTEFSIRRHEPFSRKGDYVIYV